MSIRNLVATEIASKTDRDPRFKGDDVWIRCPYHNGGNERTGSLRIRLGSDYKIGSWQCFGCKKWSSDWNELAKKLKLKQTKLSDQTYGVYDFSFDDVEGVDLPILEDMHKWPVEEEWRGINGKTLSLMQARMSYRRNKLMLYFPVHVRQEYVGGVNCELAVTKRLKDEGQLSYLNIDGAWSKKNLFGYDIAAKKSGPLWIVEGPRDTANLNQLGGRASGLLGSYVGKGKIEQIESLDPPLVIIATDPDKAGELAAEELQDSLTYIPTVRVNFPPEKDPANMTPKVYDKITKRIHAQH